MSQQSIKTETKKLENTLKYENQKVLSYAISYPEFQSAQFGGFIRWVNQFYYARAIAIAQYCETGLYQAAAQAFRETQQQGLTVPPYDFVEAFEVHCAEECVLSLCIDRGVYTGGANGTSTRRADTWDMAHGRKICLADFYPTNAAYRADVLEEINRQIARNQKQDNVNYLEEVERLVAETFDENQFFLDARQLWVFFQPITIAPHASGFPEFGIGLSRQPVWPVRCEQ